MSEAQSPEPLNEEQVQFYRENGYLVVPNVLSPEELANIREAVDDAYSRRYESAHDNTGRDERYDAVFHQKVNLWQVHEGIRRHTFDKRIAAMARQLLDVPALRLWHDQTLVKQPGAPTPTPFHQDLPYWPMVDEPAITAWTALDDVDEPNSCMQYVPGSHTWGRYPGNDFTDPDEVAKIATDHADECVAVSAPVPAGSVIFHHSLTFHGATANVTDKARRAMIIHYMADGMRFNGKGHLVPCLHSLQPGDAMNDDEIWPVLATAA
jgi:ectoine hydroxylase-related dioxygenase (phytanoyl-CoA dioxygenase family)